jgi:hypothetical protein
MLKSLNSIARLKNGNYSIMRREKWLKVPYAEDKEVVKYAWF